MLGTHYKFHFQNDTGVQLDFSGNSANEKITVDYKPWKLTSAGAVSYGSEITKTYTAADVADGAGAEFTETDNSSDLNMGLHGDITVQTDNGSASGTVQLYIEVSTDGGTTYPSDSASFDRDVDLMLVAVVTMAGAQTRTVNFEV